jgi:RND family efflux transporter MFP subunit
MSGGRSGAWIGLGGALVGVLVSARGLAAELDCVIQPKSTVTVSAPIEGLVATVAVDRGDVVKAGDVVATLESTVESAQVTIARARAEALGPMRSAEARLRYAESTLNRQDVLGSMKVVSDAERDKASSSRLVAEAELLEANEARKSASYELERARAVLELRTIRSPVNGVVVERMRSPGEYADPPQIVKIAQVDPLSVEVFAPVALYGRIALEMKAQVVPEAPVGGTYTATVRSLDRVIDAGSGTFGVRLELANPGYAIPAGLNCRVRFPIEAAPATGGGRP